MKKKRFIEEQIVGFLCDAQIGGKAVEQLGRVISDTATVASGNPENIDTSVVKLTYSFNSQGLAYQQTSYDSSSNVVNQVQDEYNGLGQLIGEYQEHAGSVNTSTTLEVQYGYSSPTTGSPETSMTYPNGRILHYGYDNSTLDSAIGRIDYLADDNGSGGVGDHLQNYQYLGLSTVVNQADGNGVTESITLDDFGRTAELSSLNSSSVVTDDFQYGYDADGNVLYKDNGTLSHQSELYGYDDLNRLTSFQRGTLNGTKDGISGTPSDTESWDLDALGNWNSNTVNGTTTDRTNNAQNQVTELGSATLGYDANGNTTTGDSGNTLVYDAWNHLIAEKSGSTIIASYSYDAKGQRIIETHGSITTGLYLSTRGQVLEEQQGGTATTQQVWSSFYVNGLIERDTSSLGDGVLDTRIYVEQDANYNVTSLTDASGTVVERIEYTAYGTATILTASGTVTTDAYGMVYRFQGGRADLVTGLIHFDHRDYNLVLGRWIEQDPTPANPYVDGMNVYQFVADRPVNNVDSTGLATDDDLKRADLELLVNSWKSHGWTLASHFLQHFLDNSGTLYTLTPEDIAHLRSIDKFTNWVHKELDAEAHKLAEGSHLKVSFTAYTYFYPFASELGFAYGGVRISVSGAICKGKNTYTYDVDVTVKDHYFFSGHSWIDSLFFDFATGAYLEDHKLAAPFDDIGSWHENGTKNST